MKSITFITGNPAKIKWAGKYLPTSLKHKSIELAEIQSLDPEEIVIHKVKEAYKHVKSPVLIEDVSLTFAALGKLPGPLIKWFHEELQNEGLCKLLDAYPSRSAISRVMYGLYDGKKVVVFDGSIAGSIAKKPRGGRGGYSPIFIPKGYRETWGEMSDADFDKTSMRKIALTKLSKYLNK